MKKIMVLLIVFLVSCKSYPERYGGMLPWVVSGTAKATGCSFEELFLSNLDGGWTESNWKALCREKKQNYDCAANDSFDTEYHVRCFLIKEEKK